jgi:SAM-dependent methyltransferase
VRATHVFGGSEEQNFWECAECTAVYLYPEPSVEEEKRFYAQEFEKFMASRAEGDRDWSNTEEHKRTNQDQVQRRWAFIEEHIRPGDTVLEIGCSSGFMLDALRDAGMICTGVEPSGEFLPYLAKQGYEAYESLDDVEADRLFDLIVHFFVFEHIRDPFAFLSQAWGRLAPGGVMVAEIPCVNDPLTSLYDIPPFEKFYWSVAHHYYYSPKALSYVLERLGLPYRLEPEQRYDLSNHMHWMMAGRPGGQGKYIHVFGDKVNNDYKEALKSKWLCDTIFLYIWKEPVSNKE